MPESKIQEILNNEIVIELIKQASEMGASVAIKKLEEEKKQNKKAIVNKRLYNTKLLLQSYRKFKAHTIEAVYIIKDKSEQLKALDILMDIDRLSDEKYVLSIMQSKERTETIIEHIDKMINEYMIICLQTKKVELKRRYDIIYDLYISKVSQGTTIMDLSNKFKVDRSTVFRDIARAVEDLTPMFFGIDGIDLRM